MKTVTIDILKLNEYKHDYLMEVFAFPSYYGKNLDALYDMVSSMHSYIDINIINYDKADNFSKKVIKVLNDTSLKYKNSLLFFK